MCHIIHSFMRFEIKTSVCGQLKKKIKYLILLNIAAVFPIQY